MTPGASWLLPVPDTLLLELTPVVVLTAGVVVLLSAPDTLLRPDGLTSEPDDVLLLSMIVSLLIDDPETEDELLRELPDNCVAPEFRVPCVPE